MNNLAPETVEQIRACFAEGLSIRKTAARCGADRNTVNTYFKNLRNGPDSSPPLADPETTLDEASLNLAIAELDKLLLQQGYLPAEMERSRQYLRQQRLIVQMRKFVAQYDPEGQRKIWNAFVSGLAQSKCDTA